MEKLPNEPKLVRCQCLIIKDMRRSCRGIRLETKPFEGMRTAVGRPSPNTDYGSSQVVTRLTQTAVLGY